MKNIGTVIALSSFTAALAAGCSTPVAPAAAPSARVGSIAFVDVSVVPLDSDRVLADQTVIVEADRITAMGPVGSVAVPPSARVVDGKGKFLMPGLADMHVHLAAEQELALYLARGVTTVRNMWGTPLHLEWRAKVEKGEIAGPAIITAGPIVDGDPPAHDGSLVVTTEEEADRAVAMHEQAGYDFVKVYNKLPAAAYRRIVSAAKAAGLPVAGHVPRSVGLEGVLDARQTSVEHLTGYVEALQSEASPVRGKFDRPSMEKKIDYVDETKLAALAKATADRGVWSCPTLTVITSLDPAASREMLARPEMKYVAPLFLAMWQPGRDPSPEAKARHEKENELHGAIIRALRDAHARIVVGTDTGNPLVVPGYATHRELSLLVQAGLTPFEALRAATHDAAEMLGLRDRGVIAVGQRADLVLVRNNPLADVKAAGEIAGVMARGRWLDEAGVASLLEGVAAFARSDQDPFAKMPPFVEPGKVELAASFEIVWGGARFGVEHVSAIRRDDGRLAILARSYDGQYGQRTSVTIHEGASGAGESLVLESDGAKGRGRVEVTRAGGHARIHGTLLSGPAVDEEAPLPDGALLGAAELVADKVLLGKRLAGLGVGQEMEIATADLSLGSAAEIEPASSKVVRAQDTTIAVHGVDTPARKYEFTPAKGPKQTLWLDANGWPLSYEVSAFGAPVVYRRID